MSQRETASEIGSKEIFLLMTCFAMSGSEYGN